MYRLRCIYVLGVFLAIFNPDTPEILQKLPGKPIQLLWANYYGYVHENECVGWDIYFLLNYRLTCIQLARWIYRSLISGL